MRLLGAILLSLAFAALGLTEAQRLRRRARLTSDFASGMELLRSEIGSRLAPMPEAAERLALYGPESTRGFYTALCAGLENLGGAQFHELWERALEQTDLPGPARRALSELGMSLGEIGDVLILGYDEENLYHAVIITDVVTDEEGNVVDYLVHSNTANQESFPVSAYGYTYQVLVKICGWN